MHILICALILTTVAYRGDMMNSMQDAKNLEITLIRLMETQAINADDYNLIHKYLVKINNDLKPTTN